MTSLNLSLSSPTTSSGYGSEEDHPPIFHFPALAPGDLAGGLAADRCPVSPSSDPVTSSRVSGGSKFNEYDDEDDDDYDIDIDVFGEICEYLELNEDENLLTEIPCISSAESEDRNPPAQDPSGKNSICAPPPRGARFSEKNKNCLNQIIPLTTEAGDAIKLVDVPITSQNSIVNQCGNPAALKLPINHSREEISEEDLTLVTSGQCTTDPDRWLEYSKSIAPGSDHHISPSTGIRDEQNPAKPRHQSRQRMIRLAAGNQRRKPVNQSEALRSACRRTHRELDDHRYFSPAPRREDQLPVPVKVQKTSLDSTGSGITGSGNGSPSNRRCEKSILETFLLTKEALNANKGSDGMLAEDNIARLYTGDQVSSRPASTTSSTSVLERILTGTDRSLPDAMLASEQCSSTAATPIDSPGGDSKETAATPPSELDINDEIFNDNNCKYDPNSILLEFLCEKLDDEVWTPSGDNGKVFSNEMDAIINSQTPNNQNDVWIHQYISDLL